MPSATLCIGEGLIKTLYKSCRNFSWIEHMFKINYGQTYINQQHIALSWPTVSSNLNFLLQFALDSEIKRPNVKERETERERESATDRRAIERGNFFELNMRPTARRHKYKLCKKTLCISGKSSIFSERIVNVWNSLPKNVDFRTLTSFRRPIQTVDFNKFLRCYS